MAGYYASAGFVMWYAVEKIFESSTLHFSATQIVSLISLAYLIHLLLDIPSSLIADRWSRSKMLALSLFFGWLAALCGGLATSFWMYSFVAVFWAFASSFHTGVSAALTYDICKEESIEADYTRLSVQMQNIFRIAIASGLALGGIVASLAGLRAPYFGSLLFMLPMAAVVWRMKEPSAHKEQQRGNSLLHMLQAARNITTSRYIFGLAVLTILTDGIMAAGLYEFSQLVYQQARLPLAVIGVATAFSNTLFFVALTIVVIRLQRFAGVVLASIYGIAALALMILGLVTNRLEVVLLYGLAIAFMQMASHWLSVALHHNVPSAERASTHSLASSIGSLCWLIASPFMAIALAERGAIGPSGIVAMVMFAAAVISLLSLVFGRKRFTGLFVS